MSYPLNKGEGLTARECFEWYYTLPEDQRSFQAVAMEFNVSEERVKTWSTKYKWREMLHMRDSDVAEQLARESIETVAEIRLKYHSIVKDAIERWVAQAFSHAKIRVPLPEGGVGEVDATELMLTKMSIKDIRDLVKLDLTLLGHKDVQDQIEGQSAKEKQSGEVARELTTTEIREFLAINQRQLESDQRERSSSEPRGSAEPAGKPDTDTGSPPGVGQA